jgi:hypothetical protein
MTVRFHKEYAFPEDPGVWSFSSGGCVAPEDLTIAQLKDHLAISGGVVYLRQDHKLAWANKGSVADAVPQKD